MGWTLLGPDDPPPVEIINGRSDYPVLLVCEHAGRAVPKALGSLGLEDAALADHIAWDIGAGSLSRQLARRLGATTILQAYSRLVIDCNRPLTAPDSIPEISDQIFIPGNLELTDEHRQARIDEIFTPFDLAIGAALDQGTYRAALSIHSFVRVFGGIERPWDISFCSRRDVATSNALTGHIARSHGGLFVGFNQPYEIDDDSDWFIPRHAERRHLPHSLIEMRNDQLRTEAAIAQWASTLASAINAFAETL